MNELITIEQQTIGKEQVNTVNARDLWEYLCVGRKYTTWIKDRIEQCGFQEDFDYLVYSENVLNSSGGRPQAIFHLSIDAAKHIGMMEKTALGFKVRKYFIECEKQLKNEMIPLTGKQYAERMLAYEIEKEEMEAKTLQLETQITSEKPLVDFARKFAASKEDILVGDLAKMLNTPEIPVGRDRLFQWLRDQQTMNHENVPYQPFSKRSFTTYRVTTKGQIYFHKKWVRWHKKLKENL